MKPISGDEAIAVAVEHVRWCRSQGMSPVEIILALEPGRPRLELLRSPLPSWDEATLEVARIYQLLPQSWNRPDDEVRHAA